MWAMDKLRHYLLGRWFIARVDHKPLVAMMKNKLNVMMEGWVDTILQFNFMTEYLLGEDNGLADALSRSGNMTPEVRTIAVEEIDDRLRWEAEKRGKELPSMEKRRELVAQFHLLGHFGVESVCSKIVLEGYWWPRMRKDIRAELNGCIKCLRFDVQEEGFHPARSIVAEIPWDHLEIDLVGPLPTSMKGNVYILTIVDVCTVYTVLRALPSKDMGIVVRKLWEVFCEYGTPRILQSDNGTEFVNRAVAALKDLYGIEHRLTTAYNPRANGLVERRNKEIGRSLKKFMEGAFGAWDDWIPLVQLSLNEAIGMRTKSAAFSLMHNRKFNGFIDFSEVQTMDEIETAMDKRQTAWNEFREIVLPGIRERTSQVKAGQEKRLNSERKQIESLQPGAMVMAIDHTRASKWDPVYEGPFRVVKQHEGGAYSLADITGEILPRRRTIDMLKPIGDISMEIPSGGEDSKAEETISDVHGNEREHENERKHENEDPAKKENETQKTKTKLEPERRVLRKRPVQEVKGKTDKFLEVESVIDHRSRQGVLEYLIKWKGFGEEENQWKSAQDFDGLATIKRYWKNRGSQEKEKKVEKQKTKSRKK